KGNCRSPIVPSDRMCVVASERICALSQSGGNDRHGDTGPKRFGRRVMAQGMQLHSVDPQPSDELAERMRRRGGMEWPGWAPRLRKEPTRRRVREPLFEKH